MPLLTIFSTATQVRLRIYTAVFEPHDSRWTKIRREADVESTIRIQPGGILSVQLDALFVNDEHRDFRAVLARIKHLFNFVVLRIECDLRSDVFRGFASG